MTTMESLIGLVNRIQRACTALGDHGGGDQAFSSLWDALPSVAVVGGQVGVVMEICLFCLLVELETGAVDDSCLFVGSGFRN